MIMIAAAGALHLFMTWKRNMREFALVGVWSLGAIAVANREQAAPVALAALIMAGILFISSGIHGYRNREFGPFRKRLP